MFGLNSHWHVGVGNYLDNVFIKFVKNVLLDNILNAFDILNLWTFDWWNGFLEFQYYNSRSNLISKWNLKIENIESK